MPTRATVSPIIQAVLNVLRANLTKPVGDGEAPEGCSPPYVVVTGIVSGGLTGSIASPEVDAKDRIQVASVGNSREQADWLRDQCRAILFYDTIDADLAVQAVDRRCLRMWVDVSTGLARDDRGLPEPLFSALDQYIIETTPYVQA